MSLKISESFPLRDLTTYKTGGEAQYFASPTNEEDVLEYINFARKTNLPLVVLGGGSNVLIADGMLDVCVMSSVLLDEIDILKETEQYVKIKVGSGVSTKALLAFCLKNSLSGVEFLTGIPGTLGGALWGNAGAQGESLESVFCSARVVTKNNCVEEIARDKLSFSYRKLLWQEEPICVLSLVLCLQKAQFSFVKNQMAKFASFKKGQPIGAKTAGCVFKNPGGGLSAGQLIDQMGGKNLKVGGAVVCQAHANFVENKNGATSADIYNLVNLIRQKIKETFGINFEYEIKFIGRF